jgi:hypothetical protein
MQLQEVYDYLTFGELSHLSVGNTTTNENLTPKIISGLNLGLKELYKRFPIKLGIFDLYLTEGTTDYYLHSSLARSAMEPGDLEEDFPIDDSNYTLTDNIIRIERILNSELEELPLNVDNNADSFFTVSHNRLRVPTSYIETMVSVEYRALPETISLTSDLETEIDIPPAFTEALINYTTYRFFAAINMNSAEAVNYYAKFEAAVAQIRQLGLWNPLCANNNKLENAGWV